MTQAPKRIGVKFSLKHEPRLKPADILPIFQRWIQEHTVEGMLIDVIDYQHVPAGPGIVLIADEADYAYDLGGGRPGLHYLRKRDLPADLDAALKLAFHCALKGALALEAEASAELAFDYSSARINFLDRLNYRNEQASYERIQDELKAVLSDIYGAPVSVSRVSDDERRLLAIRVDAEADSVNLEDISRRLQENRQTA